VGEDGFAHGAAVGGEACAEAQGVRCGSASVQAAEEDNADRAFDAATCIGCGACAAACPNASASLFLGAKITHLGELHRARPNATRWSCR
jgi:succinate dehydrogenase/fumarate reductase-like Fe-S protein